MARNHYLDGAPDVFLRRGKKFGQHNIKKYFNHTYYSYMLKGDFLSGDLEKPGAEIGTTLTDLVTRIRTSGDTVITLNLKKDANLRPAGRLRGIKGRSEMQQTISTGDETIVIANPKSLSFSAQHDILNMGGKDQLRFITENELIRNEPTIGDQRNVGVQDLDTSNIIHSFALSLKGCKKVLLWDETNKQFVNYQDSSTKTVVSEVISYQTIETKTLNPTQIYDNLWVSWNANEDNDNILILYVEGGKTILSEIRVMFDGVNFQEVNKTIIKESKNSTLRMRIIDSKDDFWYVWDKENQYMYKVLKTTLEVVLETKLDKDYESMYEAKDYLMGYYRTKPLSPNNFWGSIKKEKVIDTDLGIGYESTNKSLSNSGVFYYYESKRYLISATHDLKISIMSNGFGLEVKGFGDQDGYYKKYDFSGGVFKAEFKSIFEDGENFYINGSNEGLLKINKDTGEYFFLKENIPSESIFFEDKFYAVKLGYVVASDEEHRTRELVLHTMTLNDKKDKLTIEKEHYSFNEDINDADVYFHPTDGYTIGYDEDGNVTLGVNSHFQKGLFFLYSYVKATICLKTKKFIHEPLGGTPSVISGSWLPLSTDIKNNVAGKIIEKTGIQLYSMFSENNFHYIEPSRHILDDLNIASYAPISNRIAIAILKDTKEIILVDINDNYSYKYTGINVNSTLICRVNDLNYSTITNKRMTTPFIVGDKTYYVYEFNDTNQFFKTIMKSTLKESKNSRKYLGVRREMIIEDIFKEDSTGDVVFTGSGYLMNNFYSDSTGISRTPRELYLPDHPTGNLRFEAKDIVVASDGLFMVGRALNINSFTYDDKESYALKYSSNGADLLTGGTLLIDTYGEDWFDWRFKVENDPRIFGIVDRIFEQSNGMISATGELIGKSDQIVNGSIMTIWSQDSNDDSGSLALSTDDRTSREDDNFQPDTIRGQAVYMPTTVPSTPTIAGGDNNFDYKTTRVDLPKFKTSDGANWITFDFLLNAALKGIDVTHFDLDHSAWTMYNKIEFFDDEDNYIPYSIARTSWDRNGESYGENLSDAELTNPSLFNDGYGNEIWEIQKAYPWYVESNVQWHFWEVSQLRYYDQLRISLQETGGISEKLGGDVFDGESATVPGSVLGGVWGNLNNEALKTMIPGASYQIFSTGFLAINARRHFSNDFLKIFYAYIPGSFPNDEANDKFETEITSNLGLGIADNAFYHFGSMSNNPSERLWKNSFAPYIMDSFLQTGSFGVVIPDDMYWSIPTPNPKLYDKNGLHTDLYWRYKNDMIQGGLRWGSVNYINNFIDENGGKLSRVEKQSNPTQWEINSGRDTKYLVLCPNNINEIRSAIQLTDGESDIQLEEIKTLDGLFTGITPHTMEVPVASSILSILDDSVTMVPERAIAAGLRTNSKLRLVFDYPTSIKRIRLQIAGGEYITFTQWQTGFKLAKDASGDEVIPRKYQSPNMALTPADTVKDVFLTL